VNCRCSKRFVGELTFDFLWFQTVDSGDLRLLIHTPRSHSGTAEKIERLLACGPDMPMVRRSLDEERNVPKKIVARST
jgi:hypothetical protein